MPRRPSHRGFFLLALFAGLLTGGAGAAVAVTIAPIPLTKGVLLVAGPHIADPRFRESIILITDYGGAGTAGLIVNHPSHVAIGHALGRMTELREIGDELLYVGGPVAFDEIFVLVRSDTPPPIPRVFANIYVGRGVDVLRQVAEGRPTQQALRLFVGYVAWETGQLEEEIARGDWVVAPPDGETVFDAEPQILWQRLIKSWSGQWL